MTANQGEEGILELCEQLVARGVGIETGLLSLEDARAFVASGIAPRCARAMVEPLDPEPHQAVAHAGAIERTLAEGRLQLEQVHHGDGIRTGVEDTAVLPDGRVTSGNGQLVVTAATLIHNLASKLV